MLNGWLKAGLLGLAVMLMMPGGPAQAVEDKHRNQVPSCKALKIDCHGPVVLFVFDESKPFFGARPCTCEGITLKACNPGMTVSGPPSGERGKRGNACVSPGGVLTEVPTVVEAVKNPHTFFCQTIGGSRVCFEP